MKIYWNNWFLIENSKTFQNKSALGEISWRRRLRYQQFVFAFYVGKLEGHEHAFPPSISNQIGTSQIPVKKSIILKGHNDILTHPGARLKAKYWIL